MSTTDHPIGTAGGRRRRFQRSPEYKSERSRAGRLTVMRRDREIIGAIARHRFLNTRQVCRLFCCDCPVIETERVRGEKRVAVPLKAHRLMCACTCGVEGRMLEHAAGCPALFRNEQHVGTRLRELYQHGYLERPIAQLQLRIRDGVVEKGSVPMIYTVTRKGLSQLDESQRASIGRKLGWVGEPQDGKRHFLEHTLAISEVSVGIDSGLRRYPHLRRASEAEMQSGMSETRRRSMWPYKLGVRFERLELAAICDLALQLNEVKRRKEWRFLIEVDRGEMPVERKNLAGTSILRKLIAYATAYEQGLHKSELGWRSCRVIILTTSKTRMHSCIAAARRRFGTQAIGRIFRFGVEADARDLLDAELVTIDGEKVRLIDNLGSR